MPLKILRQDIKTIKTDAIVCSSPNQLEPVIVAERASASASYKIQVEEQYGLMENIRKKRYYIKPISRL